MPRAVVIGGTGQIGRAVVLRLARGGWSVRAISRGRREAPDELATPGVELCAVDRDSPAELRAAIGRGADAVVDVVAYDARHGRQLAELSDEVGCLIAMSSAAVYVDDEGRALEGADLPEEMPRFTAPIAETQPTVAAREGTYAGNKVALEQALLGLAPAPVTIVRPGAVYGPGARRPREWHFVKRALDGRRHVPLAYRGESVFHTTSVANLAELVCLAAESPRQRVLNCGDPAPLSVRAIGEAIFAALGYEAELVLLDGQPRDGVGATPWSLPGRFELDMSAARDELGYAPVTTYADAVRETCEWLVAVTRQRDWREAFPLLADESETAFDYATEDRLLPSA